MTEPGSVATLEARIAELEAKLSRISLGNVAGFSAGDCTNGCTDACTHGCTNGCTGSGCLIERPDLEKVVSPVRKAGEGVAEAGGLG